MRCGRLGCERFRENVTVSGSQCNAAESSECGGDVGGSDFAKILARLDAVAHQENWDVLIVVVGRAVTSTSGGLTVLGRAVDEPVGFRHEIQIAASRREEARFDRGADAVLRYGAVLKILGPVNGGDSWNGHCGVGDGLHGAGGVSNVVVDGGIEVEVTAANACDWKLRVLRVGGFGEIEWCKSFYDCGFELGKMEKSGVDASSRHVFGDRHGTVIGAQGNDVISAADLRSRWAKSSPRLRSSVIKMSWISRLRGP